jgi:nucleoside-diphosphate-sugar epimerase
MKALVTGGGGFLGGAICRQLLDRGYKVTAFQRSASPELEKLGVAVIRGDISDFGSVSRAFRGIDAVFHTAAKAGLSVHYDDFYRANVVGTKNVIDACLENRISKLVFTSSPSVTHADGDVEGGDESLPYAEKYNSPYPATKARSEQMIMAAHCRELHTVSLRPHLIWGPGDNHLLPKLMERAKAGKLKLPGADKLIDTVYIDNAARAHLLALHTLIPEPQRVGGKTYFISNDDPWPQGKIIRALLKAAGREVEIETISPAIAKTAGSVVEAAWKALRLRSDPPLTRWSAEHLSTAHWYDISAAKRDLGYVAGVSMKEGLRRLAKALATTAS